MTSELPLLIFYLPCLWIINGFFTLKKCLLSVVFSCQQLPLPYSSEQTLNSWVSYVPVYCSPPLYSDNYTPVLPSLHLN